MANELILIVEDNPKNLKLVRDTLQVTGYQTIEADTGEEGVRLAQERHPALILMDIQLPGINGIEALQRLRADPATRPTPVIAITGLRDDPGSNASHGRGVRRLPWQADQRQATADNGARDPRQAVSRVVAKGSR
jgi:two-component system, cell cycle response regulator DivK